MQGTIALGSEQTRRREVAGRVFWLVLVLLGLAAFWFGVVTGVEALLG